MDNGSKDRGIDKIRDCVVWAIERSTEHMKTVCPPREKWTWERLLSWGSQNNGNNKNKKPSEIRQKPVHGLKNQHRDNIYDETTELNTNCCHIKLQDPCAACCCEIDDEAPSTCPEGRRIIRKSPKCGCNNGKTKSVEACCDACRNRLHSA